MRNILSNPKLKPSEIIILFILLIFPNLCLGENETVNRKIRKMISKAMNSNTTQEKINAIRRLGGMGKKARIAIPALSKLLKHNNKMIAVAAMKSLVEIGVPDVFPHLTWALEQRSFNLQYHTIKYLRNLKKNAVFAVPSLKKTLNDPLLCHETVLTLGFIGKSASSAVPELIALLKNDSRKRIHLAVIYTLGKIRDKRAVSPLIKVLQSGNYDNKSAAAIALGEMKKLATSSVSSLVRSLVHEKYLFSIEMKHIKNLNQAVITKNLRETLSVNSIKSSGENISLSKFAVVEVTQKNKEWIISGSGKVNSWEYSSALLASGRDNLIIRKSSSKLKIYQYFIFEDPIHALKSICYNNQSALENLRSLLQHPDFKVRRNSAYILILLNDKKSHSRAQTVLKKGILKGSFMERMSSISLVSHLDETGKCFVNTLIKALKKEKSPLLQAKVIRSLVQFRQLAKEALPALRKAENSKIPLISKKARLAIKWISK